MARMNVYDVAKAAKARAVEAEARAKVQKRRDDTHAKVLMGSFLQETFKRNPEVKEAMRGDLTKFMKNDKDKALLSEWLQPTTSEPAQ